MPLSAARIWTAMQSAGKGSSSSARSAGSNGSNGSNGKEAQA
jgi:hypothetical protein